LHWQAVDDYQRRPVVAADLLCCVRVRFLRGAADDFNAAERLSDIGSNAQWVRLH